MEMAVLFLRKSDENAEADDFDIQEDITRAYAESKGYGVYAVYREAHSGKHSPLTRTVLRQAINDIKAGRASVMVIRSYDRLARTIEQTYHIIFEVEQLYHGRIEAAKEQLDRESPTAKIQFAVMAAASEMERDRIYERMEAGKRKRAARGHLMGSPNPRYGYAWVDDQPGKRTAYAIDLETGPVVQRMFAMTGEGMSTRAIARELNKQGVATPSTYAARHGYGGKRQVAPYWHMQQVRVIVSDERYAGKPVAFRHKTTREYQGGQERLTRTLREDAVALSTDAWPALVTAEQFALAQRRLQANTAGRPPLLPALMRRHVFCGICGRVMSPQKINGRHRYMCRMRVGDVAAPAEACRAHSMLVEKADALGWNAVKYLLASREQFVALLRERFAHPDDGAMLASAAGALREKQEELATLAGSVGLTTNATVRQSLIAQMESVAETVSKLEAQYRDTQRIADSEKAAEAWIQTTLDRIYGWVKEVGTGAEGTYPTAEQVAQFDALPFEVKRTAVEASGVKVNLFPTGWLQEHLGLPEDAGRVIITFEHAVDVTDMARMIQGASSQIDNNNQKM